MPHGEADYFVRRLQVLVTGEVNIRRPHESVETAKTFNAILLQKYPEHARALMDIHDRATDAADMAADAADMAAHLALHPEINTFPLKRKPGRRPRKLEHAPEDPFAQYEASSDDDNCTADVGPPPPFQAVSSQTHAPAALTRCFSSPSPTHTLPLRMTREDEKRVVPVLKESQTRGGTVDGTVHRKDVHEDK